MYTLEKARKMKKKYKLTKETITFLGRTLSRIEAVISFGNVKKGTKGGFVENENNLDQTGDAWVYGDALVSGDARVSGDAWVYGDARVSGNAWEVSPLQIQGTSFFVSVSSFTEITIGCHTHTIDYWLKNYRRIGKKEGCSDFTIKEYKKHIDHCIWWLKNCIDIEK